MQKITELLISSNLAERVISNFDLKELLLTTNASRYALVNKAINKGELIHLKRGAYLVNHPLITKKFTGYYIACQMVSHSYISFESALSYHQWIPERVNIICAGLLRGRSKDYSNAYGTFQYKKIITTPCEGLLGVEREIINSKPVLMATPVRAFFDLVYERNLEWQGLNFLTESLRIESEHLSDFTKDILDQFENIYRSKTVIRYITKMKKALYSS